MSVQRVVESPRVTKPYSDEQWRAVDAFGRRIEQQLAADDVRVTIGGEPTFVAMDDPDAPEWNTAATGPTKRRFAADLIQQLRARFAPGGLLHYGQGKWYPGEQLPRWAFSLYWRRDGKALWRDGQADRRGERRLRRDGRAGTRAPARAWRTRSSSTPTRPCRRTRILGTSSARNASCPRISIRPPTASTIPWRGRGSRASSSEAWTSPSATCLPVQRWNAAASPAKRWSTERLDHALGQVVRRAGRLAARVSLAAAVAASSAAVAVSARRARRSVRRARRAAGPAPGAAAVLAAARSARRGASGRRSQLTAPGTPCAHGHRGRAARRASVRVHAARGRARGLPRSARGRRGRERRARLADSPRRLRAAARSAVERDQGDARPRRHRGQRAAGRRAGTRCARSPKVFTRTRITRGS